MYRYLLSRLRARGRASAIFLGFLTVAVAPQSWGLGLGEIELDSALNQEFKATIERLHHGVFSGALTVEHQTIKRYNVRIAPPAR